jgi:hypothetical protein
MGSATQFEDLDPAFFAALRVAVGREPIPLAATCLHAPITCVWKSQEDHSCKIQSLRDAWQQRDRTYPSHDNPLVVAITDAGGDSNRARMVINEEGYGMTLHSSSSVISAYRRLEYSSQHPLPAGAQVCEQCRPGTNTFTLRGSTYEGSCHFVPVSVANHIDVVEEGKVLCIGAGGELRLCGKDEFMAVSHVWEHGWQGDSERGICTRTLDVLVFVANLFGLEWIWIDIAMISGKPVPRISAISSMNFVYTASKVTVVFDRLLLSMKDGSDRERVMAISLTDWMTRVWTMQEALLSRDLVFLFGDCHIHGSELQSSMIHKASRPNLLWQQYIAIEFLCTMLEGHVTPTLDRIFALSKERLTTKKEDMSRAVFPLFNLTWPGRSTTLEEGQAMILQHLGKRAARLAPLHGPIMPQPWSWAPLTLAGTHGFLQPSGEERPLHRDGLRGRWAAWRIVKVLDKIDFGEEGYPQKLARLTGSCYDIISFQMECTSFKFQAGVFSRLENTYPWSGKQLFLTRKHNTGTQRTDDMDLYDLVIKDYSIHSSGMALYHRVGSALGALDDSVGGRGLDIGDLYLDGLMN